MRKHCGVSGNSSVNLMHIGNGMFPTGRIVSRFADSGYVHQFPISRQESDAAVNCAV
jgi:hypothetical protein